MVHTLRLDNYSPTPRKLVLGTNSSYGTESIKIERGAGWDGLNLTATWHIPGREEPLRVALLDGDAMDVPPEVTKEAKDGVLVLAGLASGVQRASCNVEYLILEQAGVYGGADAEPTPELAAQVLEAALQAKADAEAAAEDAADAKANADKAQQAAENAAADAAKAGPHAEAALAAKEAAKSARDKAIAAQQAAEKAANAAATSKSEADTLAVEAARAAEAAENSKTAAYNAANFAGEKATAAQQAVGTATAAANYAGQSASAAAASKAAAETAAKTAQDALTATSDAKAEAVKAQGTAQTAAKSAQDAQAAAEKARNEAKTARDAAAKSAAAAKTSEDAAAKSAADADSTAKDIKDSMAQISENKEAVSKLKEDLENKVPKSDYAPEAKTDAMTQPVGKDSDGKLWTAPGSGGSGIAVSGATVGQTIKISAVDEGGVPTAWEPVDLPSGGDVSDVQIDGASIVGDDGKAVIPVAGYEKYGLIKYYTAGHYGYIIISKNGSPMISFENQGSGEDMLLKRVRNSIYNIPFLAKAFDLMVKHAMCDTGTATSGYGMPLIWSDAERISALLRLGCTVDDNGFVKWAAHEVAE